MNAPIPIAPRSLLVVALLAGRLASPAASAAEPHFFTLHSLGKGVYGAVARPGSGAGSNAGVVIGDEAVAVVDTFQSANAARELLDEIHRLTSLPVRFVVNTHYHLDHVAGNGVFHDAGAVILAQSNVRAWERTENLKWWGAEVPEKARKLVASLVLPDLGFDAGIHLYLGNRRVEVRTFPGHTGSDSVVTVPDAEVVLTGDLFWNHTLPNTTDADTAAWIATARRLASEHPEASLLPGHGEPGTAADLRAFGDYLEALQTSVSRAISAGRSGSELLDTVLPALQEAYGSWALFDHFAEENVTQQEAEQRGTKRRP